MTGDDVLEVSRATAEEVDAARASAVPFKMTLDTAAGPGEWDGTAIVTDDDRVVAACKSVRGQAPYELAVCFRLRPDAAQQLRDHVVAREMVGDA